MLSFVNNYRWYILFFIIGALSALPYNADQIHGAFEVVGVLMLVALFASLLVPFAAFSYPERHYKWLLQNAPLAAFGAYTMEVVKEPTLVKVVLVLAAMSMHISYWMSGIHSRAYRFEQFRTGFGTHMPKTLQYLTTLNAVGRSDVADIFIQSFFAGQDLEKMNGACAMECVAPVVTAMREQMLRDIK